MKELLENPEKYRTGPNYKATNIVFPVEFQGTKYIAKKPRTLATLANAYYTLQDKFFYGTRKLSTSKSRFQNEASKLEKLDGLYSPKLLAYENNTIIREFMEGRDFRSLSHNQDKKETLEKSLQALDAIHQKGIVIGDAHVKNILLGENEKANWIDFDGVFDESNLKRSKARDLLKFIYSTYSATKSSDLTCYSAELTSTYSDKEVKETLKELADSAKSELRLWFPTRIPIDGTLKVVHGILRAYL